MKLTVYFFVVQFILVPSLGFGQVTVGKSCQGLFSQDLAPIRTPQTQQDHKDLALLRQINAGTRPRFITPQDDQNASLTWKGETPPKMLQQMLPDGISVVDHSLYDSAGPDLVKLGDGSSYFTTLRAELDWNGQPDGTNIGVPITALQQNANRQNKSLVREDAKAVFIFLHGGGTTRTGHHVASTMMSALQPYGIEVISLDLPWHGEGSRYPFANAKEQFEYLRAFVRKYISPSGKPIFLGGHSYGGMLTDMYMREYENDDLFKGLIPMSWVNDAKPDGAPEEKALAAQAITEQQKASLREQVVPEDRDLDKQMLQQDNISLTGGYALSIISRYLNWTMPNHKGKNYLPALYIAGKGDWLQVGYEKIVDEYIRSLENVKLVLYGPKILFTDKSKNPQPRAIGHGIFSHYMEGTNVVETYALIRDFIGEHIGQNLSQNREKIEISLLGKVLQAYANNITFREFVDHAQYIAKRPTELLGLLNARHESLKRYVIAIQGIQKNSKLSAENKAAEIAKIAAPQIMDTQQPMTLEQAQSEMEKIFLIRKLAYALPGPEGDTARQLIAEYDQNTALITAKSKEAPPLRAKVEELKKQKNDLENRFTQELESTQSVRLNEARALVESTFQQLQQANEKFEELSRGYIQKLFSSGQPTGPQLFQWPPELIDAANNYSQLVKAYQSQAVNLRSVALEEAEAGNLSDDIQEIYRKYYGPEGVESQLKSAQLQLDQIDRTLLPLYVRQQIITKEMVEKYSEGYFQLEVYRFRDVLNQPIASFPQYQHAVNGLWSEWGHLWR